MKTSTSLLLVSMLGVVLVAPPAYPQKTQDQLNSLMTDSINLKNSVKDLQTSSDQKSAEIIKLLNETLARFATIESKMQTLSDNLNAAMKSNDEKSAKSVQETRTALDALKKDFDAGMVGVEGQIAGLRKQFNDAKNTEQQLPTAAEAYSHAYAQLTQGFYDDAIGEFREFLKGYIDPVRVPLAQFYIGDALLAQKKPDQAVVQFDMFLEKYPTSDRKCLALYRKGQAHAELKETPKAQAAMTAVTRECPNTQEAANAAQDLKSLSTPRRGQ